MAKYKFSCSWHQFSNKDELRGKYYITSENFNQTCISSFSFTKTYKIAEPIMNERFNFFYLLWVRTGNTSLQCYGSQKHRSSVRYLTVDMGKNIRVNAISAGLMKLRIRNWDFRFTKME